MLQSKWISYKNNNNILETLTIYSTRE